MKTDGHGVESTCHALREQGVQVAPRSYRAWKRQAPAERVLADAAVIDVFTSCVNATIRAARHRECSMGVGK